MSNPYLYNAICRPVGLGSRIVQLRIGHQLDMKALSKDLKMLFRSQGFTVYTVYSPNVLVLQIHAFGVRGHYYTVKVCQSGGDVLVEAGITNGRVLLEEAGVSSAVGAISDLLLHDRLAALISGAFAGVDVASVLGSYQQEDAIIQQVINAIYSYGVQPSSPRCPNCGQEVKEYFKFCPNCGYKLK
ncbi:MAG: zinc-ribbon domain-containing protein [Candidatus Aramenus sp.]|nr:zinc-ribbon domain-containing protein [Candidatus Aramenus sp.]